VSAATEVTEAREGPEEEAARPVREVREGVLQAELVGTEGLRGLRRPDNLEPLAGQVEVQRQAEPAAWQPEERSITQSLGL